MLSPRAAASRSRSTSLLPVQPQRSTLSSRVGWAAAGLFLLLALGAYVLGTNQPRVHTAEVECMSAPGTISCELPDGWYVGVPLDVGWSSASGGDHFDGRPECLPPTGRGLEPPVRVSWIPVEAEGRGWRQVVWVTCL